MTKVVTERELVTELLKRFKDSPCLWDTTNKHYFNKEAKKKQYEMMLEIYLHLDPNGTVQSLKRKLEHFRAAYRRERRKVENSTVTGNRNDLYMPNLWYYHLLTFLNGKPDNSSDDEEDENSFQETKKRRISPKVDKLYKTKTEGSEEQSDNFRTNRYEPDYIATYAESIAKQLKELEEPVRYEAERFISEVIYRARTGTLSKYSPQVVDTLMIPQLAPSWYDNVADQGDLQEPTVRVAATVGENFRQDTDATCDVINVTLSRKLQ